MRDPEAVTTLEYRPNSPMSIDMLLSQNASKLSGEPMMVAQVYEDEYLLNTVWFHEDQARALRNHLNRFLAHCERRRKEKS